MKKKLLFIRHPFSHHYLKMVKDDHDILVVSNKKEKDTGLEGVTDIKLTYRGLVPKFILDRFGIQTHFPRYIVSLHKELKKHQPDIIVTSDLYQFSTWQCLSYVRKNPHTKLYLFVETKMLPKNFVSRSFMRFFLKMLDLNSSSIEGVLTYTDQGKVFLSKTLPKVKVSVCPTPIDIDRFSGLTGDGKDWLPNDCLRIIMNARFAKFKRHQDLFLALAKLKKVGRRFKLTLVSRSEEGRGRAATLVDDLDLNNEVEFADVVDLDEIPELYHEHDVLVLPSYNEAIGIVVPEAMAGGLPTVTSDTVGANVYVESEKTGFVFKTGDVDDLKETLLKCYDAEKLKKMGESAKEHLKKNFSLEPSKRNFLRSLGLYK